MNTHDTNDELDEGVNEEANTQDGLQETGPVTLVVSDTSGEGYSEKLEGIDDPSDTATEGVGD